MIYSNSPFKEGVLEVAFENSDPGVNLTLPGLFYSKISDDYPAVENIANFNFSFPTGNGSFSSFTSPISRFKSNNDTLVQIGKDFFAYNTLPPYKDRETNKQEMIRLLSIFADLNKTSVIKYVSIKLLNHFNFDKGTNLESKFKFSITKALIEEAEVASAVFSIAEFVHEGNTAVMKFQSFISNDESKDSYALELGYHNFKVGDVTLENIGPWLDKAYSILVRMFISVLTPEFEEELK